MKTILAPVDFSAVSTNAAKFAGHLAAFYNATLWLYHCYDAPVVFAEYPVPFITDEEVHAAAEHELEKVKKQIIDDLHYEIPITLRTEMSDLQSGLQAMCNEINPDLVAIGLSGSNTLTRLVVGSNTIKAIHNLKSPVLAIPPMATFNPVRKIGFACDFKHVLETTPVQALEKIVKGFNAELHVLNVDFNHGKFTEEMFEEGRAIYRLLGQFNPQYHSIEASDVTEGINWFADSKEIDWIVAIPKKHNLMESLFRRSHTKELLHHTHVPVLCIHE